MGEPPAVPSQPAIEIPVADIDKDGEADVKVRISIDWKNRKVQVSIVGIGIVIAALVAKFTGMF